MSQMTETELRRFYVGRCTEVFDDVRLFIRNTGVLTTESGGHFKAGIKGQCDIWGWLYQAPYPMPLEIELKNVKTPQSTHQKAWAAYCNAQRVPYVLLRAKKDETPLEIIDRWVAETGVWLDGLRG